MTRIARLGALLATLVLAALALAACQEKTAEAPPPPDELHGWVVGHFCGMNVSEHPGPKGQIILRSRGEPVWFTSVRDAFAFTMLPEEAKDIRAIYVSDMGKAENWEQPGIANWINAKQAFFVIGSRARSGMGAEEAVPFSERAAAQAFAAEKGGRVVAFSEVPRDYVLGSAEAAGAPSSPPASEAPGGSPGPDAPSHRHAH